MKAWITLELWNSFWRPQGNMSSQESFMMDKMIIFCFSNGKWTYWDKNITWYKNKNKDSLYNNSVASWMEIKLNCKTVCTDLILHCTNHVCVCEIVWDKCELNQMPPKCQKVLRGSVCLFVYMYTPFWTLMHYENDERLNKPLMSQMRSRERKKKARDNV